MGLERERTHLIYFSLFLQQNCWCGAACQVVKLRPRLCGCTSPYFRDGQIWPSNPNPDLAFFCSQVINWTFRARFTDMKLAAQNVAWQVCRCGRSLPEINVLFMKATAHYAISEWGLPRNWIVHWISSQHVVYSLYRLPHKSVSSAGQNVYTFQLWQQLSF